MEQPQDNNLGEEKFKGFMWGISSQGRNLYAGRVIYGNVLKVQLLCKSLMLRFTL